MWKSDAGSAGSRSRFAVWAPVVNPLADEGEEFEDQDPGYSILTALESSATAANLYDLAVQLICQADHMHWLNKEKKE